MELAERLRADNSGIPVILVDSSAPTHPGGYASVLQDRSGARALAKPELSELATFRGDAKRRTRDNSGSTHFPELPYQAACLRSAIRARWRRIPAVA